MRLPQLIGCARHSVSRSSLLCQTRMALSPTRNSVLVTGMIMLGSVLKAETEFGRLMKQPDEIAGAETQSSYIVVLDADAMYARAKAAGAKIVIDIKDENYGGRGFSCYDLEGHLWNFGTYDP